MRPQDLSIHDFTYALPEERIARQPLAERDASKLLVYRNGAIADQYFRDLPGSLPSGTLLVLNDTRVVNARIIFHRASGARIEVLCLEPSDGRPVEQAFAEQGQGEWNAFVGNAKRWKEGEELTLRGAFPRGASSLGGSETSSLGDLALRARRTAPERIAFIWEPATLSFAEVLHHLGHVPLPPYMHRPDEAADRERYNTVFARHDGSVAAPTASLHFTSGVLDGLTSAGIHTARLTLHVGAGTFLPVKSDRMADHTMHREQVRVPVAAMEQLAAQLGKAPIVPVGTTALRTLESLYWHGVMVLQGRANDQLAIDQWEPYGHDPRKLPNAKEALLAVADQLRNAGQAQLTGATRLLIAPGYSFRLADGLVTNFHQPQSTLLLLVAAFIGADWRRVYDHALANGYRFLSYGDGSLLWRG